MTSIKRLFASLVLIAFAPGCATIVAGGADHVPVNSNPQGAKVYLNGQFIGTTPLTATIARHDDAVFRFEKDGFQPAQAHWDKVVNGWVFGNILLGGIIGIGIDLATSNQGKHSEVPLVQSLVPTKRVPASVQDKDAD